VPPVSSVAPRTYPDLPLSFEPNSNQTDPEVRYFSRGKGFVFFLTKSEAVLVSERRLRQTVLRMKFLGSRGSCRPVGRGPLAGTTNYFVGKDPARWRTRVPAYASVEYREIYPGVSLSYHGRQRQLEYDFSLAPGVSPSLIRLGFEGARQIRLDRDGGLVLTTEHGEIRQEKPFAYQEVEGVRKPVPASFAFRGGNEVGFEVHDYDPASPLVIDPVLSFSTYLGGGGSDAGNGIAVDSSGNVYVAGETASLNFPTTAGVLQSVPGGGSDVFVAKLNPAGTALLYSTYLGGAVDDRGNAVAVDSSGNAYVTGETLSGNFPTTPGAFQTTNRGGSEAFAAKLNPAGTALLYSTYLGGTGFSDRGNGIAVDSSGSAFVTGRINSTNFPTTPGAFQTFFRGGAFDSFVTKFNATGTGLIYSTYLGGSENDAGFGVALGPAGNAYAAGGSNSLDFPTTSGAYQSSSLGPDPFLTVFNGAGSGLLYSTFLGGSFAQERANGVATDSSGNAYLTGEITSPDFPTVNPAQGSYGGGLKDGFVAKLNPAASGVASLVSSTYLGGSGDDRGNGIAVDGSGSAHVTGQTASPNFPTRDPLQSAFAGTNDAFATTVSPSGAAFLFSTYLGAIGDDRGLGIAADPSGNVFLTGSTDSTSFPRVNPLQSVIGGGSDAFVARIAAGPAQTPTPTPTGTALATPTLTPTVSGTPLPGPGPAAIPTLSLPVLLILAAALAGTALFLMRKP